MERPPEEMFPILQHDENEILRANTSRVNATHSSSVCEVSVAKGGDAEQLGQNSSGQLLDDTQPEIRTKLNSEETLELRLYGAMVKSVASVWHEEQFLLDDDLNRIIDVETVKKELEKNKIATSQDSNDSLSRIADQICGVHRGESPQDGKTTTTTRRRIFAILVLIYKTSAILDVIKEGLYDWDLPLAIDKSETGPLQLKRKGVLVDFSQSWRFLLQENFYTYQWKFLTPYIEMRTQSSADIKHYAFDQHVILPVTSIENLDPHRRREDLSRIKIHPAYRNSLSGKRTEEPWLVLKRVWSGDEQVFRAEVELLERLRRDNLQLLQPLATYKHGSNYFLVFPFADGGNLDSFFQSHLQADQPPRDAKLSEWLASQFLGLSKALTSLGDCQPNLPISDKSCEPQRVLNKYGSHGNLKPQNILWFKEVAAGDSYPLGTFRISDFGLTSSRRSSFKSVRSMQDLVLMQMKCGDLRDLGYILAELVTWYLLGGDGAANFTTEHMADTNPDPWRASFFLITGDPEICGLARKAKAASIRKHFDTLRNLSQCTDFLLDLINFLDEKLLPISCKDCCKASELLEFAESIHRKCREENRYCLERTKPFTAGPIP
ncbi:hypothetical protein GGR51DRAFT_576918 [Nemania sp. FL0031]|nr:hypothetical protein GGR51DRAFT_576918 [Nemania sp. FL0031]